mmetsp:Transcript_69530/g.214929  ORF Transcript_69530/g.214929 Transcript_69530/m.214929 type:complete len:150 (-) Transcript_69530:71-520(-)
MARLVLLLALLQGAAAINGAMKGKDASEGKASEEVQAFESEGSALNAAGFKAFLESSSHSARSQRDRLKHEGLVDRLETERSVDISVSDHFAEKVEEAAEFPSLQQLARMHWDGLKNPAEAKAAKQALAGGQSGSRLRDLLMTAGHAGN